jgi:hypothetical protein
MSFVVKNIGQRSQRQMTHPAVSLADSLVDLPDPLGPPVAEEPPDLIVLKDRVVLLMTSWSLFFYFTDDGATIS